MLRSHDRGKNAVIAQRQDSEFLTTADGFKAERVLMLRERHPAHRDQIARTWPNRWWCDMVTYLAKLKAILRHIT